MSEAFRIEKLGSKISGSILGFGSTPFVSVSATELAGLVSVAKLVLNHDTARGGLRTFTALISLMIR